MFEEKLLNETRSEYEQWLKTPSLEHRDMFRRMVINTKRENPKLTEEAARQQGMTTLDEMGVMA